MKQKKKPQSMLEQIAQLHGVSVDEVVREMQAAIDAAWNSPVIAIQEQQRKLFPRGKPSVGEFILVMAAQAKSSNSQK